MVAMRVYPGICSNLMPVVRRGRMGLTPQDTTGGGRAQTATSPRFQMAGMGVRNCLQPCMAEVLLR